MMTTDKLRVEGMKLVSGAGSARATTFINIANQLQIFLTVMYTNNRFWIAYPSRSTEQDGERRWFNTITVIDAALKREIGQAVLTEFHKLQGSEPGRAGSGSGKLW